MLVYRFPQTKLSTTKYSKKKKEEEEKLSTNLAGFKNFIHFRKRFPNAKLLFKGNNLAQHLPRGDIALDLSIQHILNISIFRWTSLRLTIEKKNCLQKCRLKALTTNILNKLHLWFGFFLRISWLNSKHSGKQIFDKDIMTLPTTPSHTKCHYHLMIPELAIQICIHIENTVYTLHIYTYIL